MKGGFNHYFMTSTFAAPTEVKKSVQVAVLLPAKRAALSAPAGLRCWRQAEPQGVVEARSAPDTPRPRRARR